MQKLTDALTVFMAVSLLKKYGIATKRNGEWVLNPEHGCGMNNHAMRNLERLGLVKIDGNTASLTEGAEKDG